jgi:hypothetical protein
MKNMAFILLLFIVCLIGYSFGLNIRNQNILDSQSALRIFHYFEARYLVGDPSVADYLLRSDDAIGTITKSYEFVKMADIKTRISEDVLFEDDRDNCWIILSLKNGAEFSVGMTRRNKAWYLNGKVRHYGG